MINDLINPGLKEKFWLVSAEMGYGHYRAIYPLKDLSACGDILIANRMPEACSDEKRMWKMMLGFYEFMSRARKIPVIGTFFSLLLDSILFIPDQYPEEQNTRPTLQVRFLEMFIRKGFADGVTRQIKNPERPLITSFYLPALAAYFSGCRNIYCIICDTDVSRVWVPTDASESNIVYFAPGTMVVKRLKTYGVPEDKILLTGFPLPLELLGDRSLNILKSDLLRRLKNLDPNRFFINLYSHSVDTFLGSGASAYSREETGSECLTLTFAVGGAGAQKEIAKKITKSLASKIRNSQVKLNLVAGTRPELRDYFAEIKRDVTDNSENVRIIWSENASEYFDLFNESLHGTDILWTKPSELSFYSALGLPIVISPAIGPQEKYNRRWLRDSGVGFKQRDPDQTHIWLYELLGKGRIAEAAWLGFLKGRKYGTYNIIDFFQGGKFATSNDPLKR